MPGKKAMLLIAISFVTLLIVLDYSIANIAIPYIAGSLSVSVDQGIYVITFFSIGNAIGLALTGFLTKKLGSVKLLLLSLVLFIGFSWICGWSVNLLMLVTSRFFQGLVSGPMLPLSQAILIEEGGEEKRTRDLTIWSTIVITGPILGPILGGYISYWYDWSWIFYINIPIGIVAFIILFFVLKLKESPKEDVKIDYFGIFLLSISMTCFQIFLDKGQQWDWWNSPAICLMFIVFAISIIFFVLWELQISHAFFQVRLLKNFSFFFATSLLVVTYGIYFGSIVVVPRWLQQSMGYDAIHAGLAVAPFGFGPILLAFFAPKIIKTLGNELALFLSFIIFSLASFYTATFLTSIDIFHIGLSRFFMGIGFACYITPLIQISIQNINSQNLSSAVGIFHFFRATSGAIGASLFTTIWQRRTIFHHERIGSFITKFGPFSPDLHEISAEKILNNELDSQSAILAINDMFYLMGWIFVLCFVLIFLYKLQAFRPDPSDKKIKVEK